MVDSYDRHIDMIDTYDMIDRWYCRHILWTHHEVNRPANLVRKKQVSFRSNL